jgi:hypothetical protein
MREGKLWVVGKQLVAVESTGVSMDTTNNKHILGYHNVI